MDQQAAQAHTDLLFRPLDIGRMHLRNRIVMAPMTREFAPTGVPGPEIAAYYRRRAEGGTGLIITEGAPPDLPGSFSALIPRAYGEDALAGWKYVTDEIHAANSAVILQLWHVGAFVPSLIGMKDSLPEGTPRLSPSGLGGPDKPFGTAMTERDIEEAIDAFASAAVFAQRAGMEGVEFHGAHGYIFDQFFWEATNKRSDRWGGDLPGRMRFATEAVAEARRRVGPDFLLCFRFSQWKQLDYRAVMLPTPALFGQFLGRLVDAGVDILHCSTRRFWEPGFEGSDLTLAGWTRKLTGKPTIAVGSVSLNADLKAKGGAVRAEIVPEDVAKIVACMERDEFDLIAVGRALLANPDWAEKVRSGRLSELVSYAPEHRENLV